MFTQKIFLKSHLPWVCLCLHRVKVCTFVLQRIITHAQIGWIWESLQILLENCFWIRIYLGLADYWFYSQISGFQPSTKCLWIPTQVAKLPSCALIESGCERGGKMVRQRKYGGGSYEAGHLVWYMWWAWYIFYQYVFRVLCILSTSAASQKPARGTLPSQVATHKWSVIVCRQSLGALVAIGTSDIVWKWAESDIMSNIGLNFYTTSMLKKEDILLWRKGKVNVYVSVWAIELVSWSVCEKEWLRMWGFWWVCVRERERERK
jgi:hypothetical protein